MRKKKVITLWEIVSHCFYVSTFTLGGGYSMLLVFEDFHVNKKKTFSKEEWEEIVVIAQSAPGAFAINFSYLLGYYTYGLLGAVLTVLAVVLPAFLCIVVLGAFLMKYMQTAFMRSFLLGVACGPIAYFSFTFFHLARNAFKTFWIFLTFVLFVVLQLFFGLPVWSLLFCTLLIIIINCFRFFFKKEVNFLTKNKKDL